MTRLIANSIVWLIVGAAALHVLFKKGEKVKRRVFFSFHFKNDVMRVQQVRNIGVIEGNTKVSKNDWEEIKGKGDKSIKKWIDDNMRGCSCVVALIGSETADRKWVKYEVKKAWKDGKGLVGIYINNLECPHNGTSIKGKNPFNMTVDGQKLSNAVKCYDPGNARSSVYNDIAKNINNWVNEAIDIRSNQNT